MNAPAEVKEVFLLPGELYFGAAPARIHTLLGSCVSMTLWHPGRCLGGMCHYLLPSRRCPAKQLDGNYADEAITLLLREVARYHARPEEFEVKLFGGGCMFPGEHPDNRHPQVSEQNIAAAYRLAAQHQLHLIAQDVGHSGYRKVIFEVWSGHVWGRHQCMSGS